MNVFVVGYDEHLGRLLARAVEDEDEEYVFHSLIPNKVLRGGDELSPPALVREAKARLESFEGSVDAIVSFTDFPAIEIASLLSESLNLPAPAFRGVLRSNHKYWSRMVQKEVAPDHVPEFAAVDPWDDSLPDRIELEPPYWIKPFNAYGSYLAFRIERKEELEAALPRIRAKLPRLAEHLRWLLERAGHRPALKGVEPRHCLVEGAIRGRQCTIEGYVHEGEPEVYGVVDTISYLQRPSFSRYQYPSSLPPEVQDKMKDVTLRVMRKIGLENGTFNVEFFWDSDEDQLWILEVNPRISQSHCELFEKVDGQSNHKVTLDLALGREPAPPHREGEYRVAGKFFVRAFEDAVVRKVPGTRERMRLEEEFPGSTLLVHVHEGSRLSEMQDQDAYSYDLAWIWIGADDQAGLLDVYGRILEIVDFQLERDDGTVEKVRAFGDEPRGPGGNLSSMGRRSRKAPQASRSGATGNGAKPTRSRSL